MKPLLNNWISISLYHENIDQIINRVAVPVKDRLYEEDLTPKVIFNRSTERGENAIIMCEIIDDNHVDKIKSIVKETANDFFLNYPSKKKEVDVTPTDWFMPFPADHIEFNDHFLFDVMETGGLQASTLAEELLSETSDTILDFIETTGEDWNASMAIGSAIQLHLTLMLAFDSSSSNLHTFYNYAFNNLLKVANLDDDEQATTNLLLELSANFEEQREMLVTFTESICDTVMLNESFEDEWLTDWYNSCLRVSHKIMELQDTGEFITPEDYKFDSSLSVSQSKQEKWPVLEYYLRAINSQLGIKNADELNLFFILKECSKS